MSDDTVTEIYAFQLMYASVCLGWGRGVHGAREGEQINPKFKCLHILNFLKLFSKRADDPWPKLPLRMYHGYLLSARWMEGGS